MKTRLHPYSIIIGLALVIVIFLTLRHPLFALFGGFCGLLLADSFLKRKDDTDDLN